MTVHPGDDHIGRRIADQRKRAGITQQSLADTAGYSLSLIKQVETGAKPATPALVATIAQTLHVDLGTLTGQPDHTLLRADALDLLVAPIRDALDLFDIGPSRDADRPREWNVLHVIAEDQCKLVRDGHIRQVAQLLPALIEEATARAYLSPAGTSEPWAVLGSVYRTAYDVATKLGFQDLAAIALDRMAWAGEKASDPALGALRHYMRALVATRLGRYSHGHRLVDAGQALLQQADNLLERTALTGQLHLGSAVLAARAGNRDQALAHLDEADRAAAVTGEVPRLRWVSFGPTNTAAHRVAALAELHDYPAAVAAANALTVPADWPASRAARHHVETAHARLWSGDKDGSLRDLQTARRLAPQQTRYDVTVRETIAGLVRAQRTTPDTLQNMAAWVGA
jgi:transcriptional regulator with XRE-family HTH domain